MYKKRGTVKSVRNENFTTKNGEEVKKMLFTIEEATDFRNIYQFELIGEPSINLNEKHIKQDRIVNVEFYIRANEWKDRFFNTLIAKEVLPEDP